jgi:hypothetical protein
MSSSASAFGVMDVVEDTNGFVGVIPKSAPPITVASDGETFFDPLGAGFDTTDGIVLNADWAPDPTDVHAFRPGFWTQLPGAFTWVLPACNPSGLCENAEIKEPVARFIFLPGSGWQKGTLSLRISDPDGSFSDMVHVSNQGPGGAAMITFRSDGIGTPEPATWAMLILGFGAIGCAARRRSSATV